MRIGVALAIAIAIAASLHAIHYLYTGLPFSTDVWPLIHDSEKLIENPSARIWDDNYFDGYNNHWPGAIIGASIASIVTGLGLREVYGLYLTIALSIALALIAYVYASRTGSRAPWINVLVLASVPSWIVFTSSTLKEVYCYPIALLILVLPAISKEKRAPYALLPLLAFASSLTHHLATAMCIGVALSAVILSLGDYVYGDESALAVAKRYGIAASITLPIFIAYYFVYGGKPLKVSIGLGDIETLVLYALAIYGVIFLTALRSLPTKLKLAILSSAAIAVALCVELELVYGIYVPKSASLALYVIPPLLLLIPLAKEEPILPRALATSITIALSYVIFANPLMTQALHRILNYVALTFGTATYSMETVVKRASLYTILTLCLVATIATQVSIDLELDPVSFYWLYNHEDVAIANYVANYASNSVSVLGGAKLEYILANVAKVQTPLRTIISKHLYRSEVLALSKDEVKFGIPVSLNLYKAPQPISLLQRCSSIYRSNSWILFVGECRWS